jgi:alkaline phosphatase D
MISCPAAEEPLSRIVFGSCANESRPQPVWEAINKLKPQLFIFTGDNVYADTADPVKLRNSYEQLAAIPGFSALRETCPVIGTWDDHDYGKNDAGEEFEGKQAAKDAFMKFFDTPEDSPLRKRGGIYDAMSFGPEGKRVQVILLDTRWFRGRLNACRRRNGKRCGRQKASGTGHTCPRRTATRQCWVQSSGSGWPPS